MVQTRKGSGLSPEEIEQIEAAQKRHAAIDPTCVNLTPEEFINWHPVGGMSWEERAQRMKEAGIVDSEKAHAFPFLPRAETRGEMRGTKKGSTN